jgi:hypothetical protein
VRHHLNVGVGLIANDGPRPLLHGVEGYCHANLTPVQAVGHGQSTTVDRSIPVIAKTDKCVIQHSQKPRTVLAWGTLSPVIGEVEVG